MQWRIVLCILCIQCVIYSYSKLLPCYSQQNNSALTVNCTALVITENCSDTYLSQHYPDLYRQEYWPDKPYDIQLWPIQEGLPADDPKYLFPGFNVDIFPPQSEVKSEIRKCVIMQISNTTLTSEHRDNKLKFVVKTYPMNGPIEYTFTTWSLPKPPPSESKTNQVRYGKTATYRLILSPDASADWVTTVSYYNSSHDRYIRIWFVPAPEKYNFLEYNVALEKILRNEGQSLEHRTTVNETRISQTEYIFWDVGPGRYRVFIQPFDDKFDSLNQCKCKSRGACNTCIRTKTSVIVVDDVSADDVVVTTEQTTISKSSTPLADTSSNKLIINQQITATGNPHVLPSIFGFLAFLLVVVIVTVIIYKFRRDSDKKNSPLNANTNQLNHCMYPTSVTNQIPSISNDGFYGITQDNPYPDNTRFIPDTPSVTSENRPGFIPPEDSSQDINSVDLNNEIDQINNNYHNQLGVEWINNQWYCLEHGR